MKRFLVFILLLCSVLTLTAQQADSSRLSALSLKLDEYYETLKHESLDVQKAECDFLIGSATDSLLRQHIALDIYEHYLNSPIMGAENVAVHVFDKWIDSGKVKMRSSSDFITAQVHADFNMQSLLGSKAPELRMLLSDGSGEELFTENDPSGVFRVLYFYDTDCAKCRIETLFLKKLIDTGNIRWNSMRSTSETTGIHGRNTTRKHWDRILQSICGIRHSIRIFNVNMECSRHLVCSWSLLTKPL